MSRACSARSRSAARRSPPTRPSRTCSSATRSRTEGHIAKPTRVAILGAGNFGLKHFRALLRAGAAPIAIPARRSRLATLAQEGVPAVASLREAGARACVVATDTGRHAADARKALALGLPCLVEKPLGVDASSVRSLAGRKVFVGCVLRFDSSLLRFRSLLPKLGRLHSVSAECASYLPDWPRGRHYRSSYSADARQGGVMRELIHEIDYAGWLYGWPKAVSGRLVNTGRLGIRSEEIARLDWIAPAGFPVSIHLDFLTRPARRVMRASGERGTLEWDGVAQKTTFTPAKGKPRSWTEPLAPPQRLALQDAAFLRAAAGGKPGNLATAADGIRALAICDAARRSSKSGRAEKVRR